MTETKPPHLVDKLQDRIVDRSLIIRGDLASCYRGQDARLDRPVFLKVMNPALTADEEIRARFEREAKAAARLDHPNLVRIHEFGEDPEEGLYMILEWISGQSLRELLKSGKRFSNEELIDLAEQLLSGLSELHRAGILHRDVKPENILMGDDDRARITDFSLAALRGSVKLTHHQAIVGTPAYLSPELAAGQSPDHRSDLFATGVVLLELATGSNPFDGDELLESIRRVREVKVDVPGLVDDRYDEELRRLISACLEKEPKQRLSSADAGLTLIGKADKVKPAVSSTRTAWRWLAPILGVFLLVVIFSFLEFGGNETQMQTETGDTLAFAGVVDEVEDGDSTEIVQISVDDSLKQQVIRNADSPTPDPVQTDNKKEIAENITSSPPPDKQTIPVEESTIGKAKVDSVNVLFSTDPWAHIMIDGKQVGTTPIKESVRLPVGMNDFTLHNPAFPVIMLKQEITDTTSAVHFILTDFVSAVDFNVSPWGEVYIDDEHRGTTPLDHVVYLLPGNHQLRIVHPALPTVAEEISVTSGENLKVTVNLNKTEFAISPEKGMKQ